MKFTFFLPLLVMSLFLVYVPNVHAATCAAGVPDGEAGCTALRDGSSAAVPAGSPVSIKNPLEGSAATPQQFIGKIISGALGIVGSIALAMFIYGGFTWMTSAGAADKVTSGKNTLIWAAIGLVIIFSSYALVKFVLTGIGA